MQHGLLLKNDVFYHFVMLHTKAMDSVILNKILNAFPIKALEKVYRINCEFRIMRLTLDRQSASKI